MIPVDRGAGSQALSDMTSARARKSAAAASSSSFPEGTRRPAGAEPRYKFGVAHLYAEIGVPCVPVALNSGLFWPRRAFRRFPGTIVVEFLDPIPPGLDKDAFFQRLQSDIETATARLVAEGQAELKRLGARLIGLARGRPSIEMPEYAETIVQIWSAWRTSRRDVAMASHRAVGVTHITVGGV